MEFDYTKGEKFVRITQVFELQDLGSSRGENEFGNEKCTSCIAMRMLLLYYINI